MKTFSKNYIGKGAQIPNMQIPKVKVKVSELLKFKLEFKREENITFEIAKMQNPDKFDGTTLWTASPARKLNKKNR